MTTISYFVLIVTIAFFVFIFVPGKQQIDYVILTLMMIFSCLGGSILALNDLGVIG